ncbi:MAG: hypothetical protein V1685_00960 [Parcubacteria group bacterium]
MIPNLTRLIFFSIRTGAVWATEAFVSYCEMVVRAGVRTMIAVVVAIGLIQASNRFDINSLLLLGVVVGGGGLVYFALVSSLGRMAIVWLSQLSDIAKEEVERLSNIFFLFIVTLFYLGIDQGQRHPTLLKIFLGIMTAMFVAAIMPGIGKSMAFFRERFRLFVLIPVVLMTSLAAVPEAITNRVTNGYWAEKITGTVATEVPFRIDEQDQVIDLTTSQPMELFERVAPKGELPKAIKGWTRDKKGNYHLYHWFDGQNNLTPMGQEIVPVTTAKLEDIIIETKRSAEKKLADEKKIADEQKAVADAETVRLKTEEDVKQETQRVADEIERQRMEAERVAQEAAQEEKLRLANQPIEVVGTILAPTDQSQDIVVVRPSASFTYREIAFEPDQSVVVLVINEVKETSNKNQYELTLQPQTLMIAGQSYDISRQTETIQLIVRKDNSRSIWKVLGGAAAGAVAGGIVGGKKSAIAGALIGVTAGTIYAVASHGKKFQLVVGNPIPPIIINPVPFP